MVNECGRTLLAGNIDIGENTENQLLNKTVTQVTAGSKVAITIAQLDADGAGPYSCDLDQASNVQGASGQTALNVTENDGGDGTIKLTATLPDDLKCIGGEFFPCPVLWLCVTECADAEVASTGDVCTIRCFNTAAAGPFGGCIAIQQTDTTPNVNTPDNISTAQTLEGIEAQVLQNQKDLGKAVAANIEAPTQDDQGVAAVDELLSIDSVAEATAGAAAAAATTAADTNTGKATGKKGSKSSKNNKNNNRRRAFSFAA